MHALLILDMQVGLLHGPDKPLAGEALVTTVNTLMSKARIAGAPIFLARHIGPPGSPIEPTSPLTQLVPELVLKGEEVIFEKRPQAAQDFFHRLMEFWLVWVAFFEAGKEVLDGFDHG